MKPPAGPALAVTTVVLTLTTGVVEAVSFLVLGPVFTAVQTGNLLLLGFALADAGGLSPAVSAISLGGFTAGAVLGARFASALDLRGRPWFGPSLLTEAALLAAAGAGWLAADGTAAATGPEPAVTALVAAAMGIRNVTTLRAGVPGFTTTVATSSLTALLAPLGADTRIAAGAGRGYRRLATVGAMFLGGLLGALLLKADVPAAVLLLAVAATVAATAAGHGAARLRSAG
ncbi:YoaK family protein [Streptomyces sp. NPDC003691]